MSDFEAKKRFYTEGSSFFLKNILKTLKLKIPNFLR
jgi:hypothetical protein